jgi:hypothetical protein
METLENIKKTSNFIIKLKSRKFQVWIVWLLLTGYGIFNPSLLPLDSIIQYFGLVSLVYIGSNVFQQYVGKDSISK